MRPKVKARKEPSERTRNLRHGAPKTTDEADALAAAPAEESAKTRVTKAVSDLAQRTASAGRVGKRAPKLTAKQQRRKEQGRLRGIAFEAKVDVKADAYQRSQASIKRRAGGWEEVNSRAEADLQQTQAAFLVLQEETRLQRERDGLEGEGSMNAEATNATAAQDDDDEEEL